MAENIFRLRYKKEGLKMTKETNNNETVDIGTWGRVRKKFLMEHAPKIWKDLLAQGTELEHLMITDMDAKDREAELTEALMEQEGVDEAMKARDPMEWVGAVNNIKHRAREIVYHELIYQK